METMESEKIINIIQKYIDATVNGSIRWKKQTQTTFYFETLYDNVNFKIKTQPNNLIVINPEINEIEKGISFFLPDLEIQKKLNELFKQAESNYDNSIHENYINILEEIIHKISPTEHD